MTYKVEVTETIGECSITRKFEEFEDFLCWEQVNEEHVEVTPPMTEEEAEVRAQEIISELFGEEDEVCNCDLGMSDEVAMEIINAGGDLKFNPETCEIEAVTPKVVMDDAHFLTGQSHLQEVVDYINSLPKGTYCGV